MGLGAGLFVLLELSARVYFFGLAGLIPARINSVHGLPQTGYTRPSPFPRLGFELKPKIAGYFKLVPFSTNSRGLRDREYALEKPENTFRVAVLGSSFALAGGVEIEGAFYTLLEEQLSGESWPTRYEFINFAVGMYHPEQVLGMLELRALDYQPDLILFTTTSLSTPRLVHDPSSQVESRVERATRPGVGAPARRSYPILQSFFLRLLAERTGRGPGTPQLHVGVIENLFMTLVERLSTPGVITEEAVSETLRRHPRGRRSAQRARGRGTIIRRLAELSETTGIPIAVVRLEFDASKRLAIDHEVEERVRALGMYYLDTRDAFRGTRASDFWIYELDPHPNRKAHEIFARVIATFLRSSGLLSR